MRKKINTTKKHSSNSSLKYSIPLLILSVIVLFFFLFKLNRNTTNMNTSILSNKKEYLVGTCPQRSTQSKDEFLQKFTVKPGDSLLKIANNQLHDSSRVSEIIILNKDKYTQLSLTNPFIEQGWELLLPPEDLKVPTYSVPNLGIIKKVNASIGAISDFWHLDTQNGPVVKPDNLTKYIGKTIYNVGDCVTLIIIGSQIISVQPQKIN